MRLRTGRRATAAALALLLLGACASTRSFHGSLTQAKVGAAPGFVPAVLSVLGTRGTLTVTNSLDKPHGFAIDELKIMKVVEAGKSLTIRLPKLKSVDYEFYCQLHDVKTGKGKHQRGLLRVAG